MSLEIKVPVLPESVTDAVIAAWHKQPGELVRRDENLVDIETDKVVLEVVAPMDGKIDQIMHAVGAIVKAQEVIAIFSATNAEPTVAIPAVVIADEIKYADNNIAASPAVRRLISESNIPAQNLTGTGKHRNITRADVHTYLEKSKVVKPHVTDGLRTETRVAMTRLRSRIAERLLQAQQNAAILTTFNEINMQPVIHLRTEYKDKFEHEHGVKLGFMSFFVLAVVEALKKFPIINASIDEKDIVYHNYFDIGVAVSSSRGLVVPILKNADMLSMADIEKNIKAFGQKANEGKLTLEELQGGTFTVSNGGIFGSLMSTPILNPPQTGILGMHKIQDRVIVIDGAMVIRPMMYVALSYDHRIVDGSESVRFLVTIKEALEDPARLLLKI
jgi:2-oxoglutarate dehydrogenase E2 component (dihydrolipoamide succinyltransferase)